MSEYITTAVFLAFLLTVSLTDYRRGYIYDVCLLPFGAAGLLFMAVGWLNSPAAAIGGALTGGGVFAFIRVVSRGGMGGGDVKLSLVLGLWLGAEQWLVAVYAAFWLGLVSALWVRLTKGDCRSIPFAPCLSVGAFIAWMWGEEIVNFYLATAL